MEDLKRYIFPAIVALLLHGFSVNFKLPNHSTMTSVERAIPIQIEINTFSPKSVISQKQEEQENIELIPKALSQPQKASEKKIITPPTITPKEQKKVIIKPDRTKKEEVIKKKNEDIDHQKAHIENWQKNIVETPPGDVVGKNVKNEPQDKLHQDKKSTVAMNKMAMPMYQQNKHPSFPMIARRRGYEGKVLLDVLVDVKGLVADLKIKHSSGHLSLDRAALHAVKSWVFIPASEGDRPFAMWVEVPIDFQLKE